MITWRDRLVVLFISTFSVLPSVHLLAQQPPALLNYQGRLVDGTNLVNGSVGLSLRLYDAASGGGLLYEDSNTVTVVDGLYATFLGDDTTEGTLVDAVEYTNLFLEVAVNGVAMTPRERVASAAYALLAGTVPDGAITPNKLALGSIGADQISPGSITAEQLAPGTITTDAIGSYQVGPENLRLAGGTTGGFILRTNATNPSASAGDRFGWSLLFFSQSFNRPLFVGAPLADAGAVDAGAVWRFSDNGSGYNFSTNVGLNPPLLITNPAPSVGAQFGFSMARRGGGGNTGNVIGAPGTEAGLTKTSGVVHVYSAFSYIGQVVNPSPAADDRFGHAVATGPDRGFMAGAPFDDAAGTDAGIAYFFDDDGSVITVFTNLLPGANDQFGSALLALDTNQFLVAAPLSDAGATDAGRVSLFNRQGIILGFFTSPSPRVGGRYGSSLALVGNGLVAIGEPGTGSNGMVHVYQSNGTLAYSIDAGFSAFETNGFGYTIAPVGPGMLAVGQPTQDFIEPDQGGVSFFTTDGEEFAFAVPTSLTGGAQAGTALLALDSRTLLVGAPFADVNGSVDAGGLAIISLDTYMPGLFAEGVRNGAVGLEQLNLTQTDGRYVKKTGDSVSGDLGVIGGNLFLLSGGKVGIGTGSPASDLHIRRGASGTTPSGDAALVMENNTNILIQALAPTNAMTGIMFGTPLNSLDASIRYNQNRTRELSFRTANARRLTIQDNGFVAIGAITATNLFQVNNAYCNGSTWVNASDRNLKRDFAPVDAAAILAKVTALPLTEWTYVADDKNARHLGPTAQDFHAAFGLGDNNGSISTIDPAGVSLAAIQALAREKNAMEEKVSVFGVRVSELEEENARLRERLEALENRLGM